MSTARWFERRGAHRLAVWASAGGLLVTGCGPSCDEVASSDVSWVVASIDPVEIDVDPRYATCGDFVAVEFEIRFPEGVDSSSYSLFGSEDVITTFRELLDATGIQVGDTYPASVEPELCLVSAEIPEALSSIRYDPDEVKADKTRGDPVYPEIECPEG